MEHYYDGPTRVPSYQKKKYRTESKGFLGHIEILMNFRIKYGLLIRSSDLRDENFYKNDDKKIQKTKNQSVQSDIRPKLIPWENSCGFCNTQMQATKECRRRNILKVVK